MEIDASLELSEGLLLFRDEISRLSASTCSTDLRPFPAISRLSFMKVDSFESFLMLSDEYEVDAAAPVFGGFKILRDSVDQDSRQESSELLIQYVRTSDAFRALACLISLYPACMTLPYYSKCSCSLVSCMLDVSRGAVMNTKTVQLFAKYCVMLGFNALQLYMEDVYPLTDAGSFQACFGYLRGGYGRDDIAMIEATCVALGIELIPCIQVAGHLENVLQWPQFAHVRLSEDCLRPGTEATRDFVEKMITAVRSAFPLSRYIHLGCDEADAMCAIDSGVAFAKHAAFCIELSVQYGFRPMVWGDMFLKSEQAMQVLLAECKDKFDIVPWDYYSSSEGHYEAVLDQVSELVRSDKRFGTRGQGMDPTRIVMATGVWSWSRFWSQLPFSAASIRACMLACRSRRIDRVMCTMWGDDGAECSPFSVIPAFAFFASFAWSLDEHGSMLRQMVYHCCENLNLDHFEKASHLDILPHSVLNPSSRNDSLAASGAEYPAYSSSPQIRRILSVEMAQPAAEYVEAVGSFSNVSKWMLWEDPLLGHLSCHFTDEALLAMEMHYSRLSIDLFRCAEKDPRLLFPAHVAHVLSLKCTLHMVLQSAFCAQAEDRVSQVRSRVASLQTSVENLWRCHLRLWTECFHPLGWEILDARYGMLKQRLATIVERVSMGGISSLVELTSATTRSNVYWSGNVDILPFLHYGRAVSTQRRMFWF
eukprot:ANDGO_07074.mRNA.1 hypothetical protein